jgi:hypothetical protein
MVLPHTLYRFDLQPHCVALDAFAFVEDRLGSAKVEIGWCEVVDALMIADGIVVFDEGPYPPFEYRQVGSNCRAECDSSRSESTAHMLHALLFEPPGQIVCHVTRTIVA